MTFNIASMLIFLSYLFYFVAGTASPLQRRWLATKKKAEGGQINLAFQVTLVTIIMSLSLPFFQPFHLQGNVLILTLLSISCGIFGAGYFISYYTAQKHVEAGVSTLVNNINTPVSIVLATLFLNEKLTPIQMLGTLLLLIGMVIVSKKHRIGKFKFDKYFMMVIYSGIFMGILLTTERALQKMTGFTAGTMLSWWAQCAFLGLITFITKDKNEHTKKEVAITGVLRFFQSLSWVILIFVVGNLSLVSSITTFKVVVVFVAAAIFLKEREDLPRKIFGSFIALAGLLLMK